MNADSFANKVSGCKLRTHCCGTSLFVSGGSKLQLTHVVFRWYTKANYTGKGHSLRRKV